MTVHMKLSEYLQSLDFLGARNSRDYVGTKLDNPAMILEENIPTWIKLTDLEDIQDCFRIFQDRVCVSNFPARYSPQFWLAHAAMSAVYTVLCSYLESHCDEEIQTVTDTLLFELWCRLISSGPGSSHLEMMDLILKHPHYPLWKYLQNISGDSLTVLVSTLKTDFVYVEEVSADHYATLMETHIDKIFKVILSDRQIEEARRGLLDLCLFYLSRMNHVPPHIGPRLSHLCFLICNRYKLENPYMGYDDWVLLRHHLKIIKDVITHPTFTVGSEAQYRAPLTLEKILQAAVSDQMLDIMFKDFMTLLVTICNHGNSKKCKRLFTAYQTELFELIDFKKGFDTTPNWMFDQCIQTLGTLSKTIAIETHIDEFIISAQHLILEKFSKLSSGQVVSWHELMVNYLVSGRTLLVREAGNLLNSSILKNNNGLNWKTYCDQWKMFIDITSDIPGAFLQTDEDGSSSSVIQGYVTFVQVLLDQIVEFHLEGRVRQNVQQCLLHCLEKDCAMKAAISSVCVHSTVTDLTDTNFIRDVLFAVNTLLRDPGCPVDDKTVADVITILLKACLQLFKSKGYVAVDLNSLFMSICLSCLSAHSDVITQLDDPHHVTQSCDPHHVTQSCDPHHVTQSGDSKADLWSSIYKDAVQIFLEMHINKGTVRSIASMVPQILMVIQDSLQKEGTIPARCIHFLSVMSSKCFQFISDHVTRLLEVFLDCHIDSLLDLLLVVYKKDDGAFVSMFQKIFNTTLQVEHDYRHGGMKLLEEISTTHPELFLASHVCQLLGTYSTESERTQAYILNIVLNVARYNPGAVATYFSILLDDSKFDEHSLSLRAPIFECLCPHSEELCQRSVDYVMTLVGNEDENISVVAMETLFLLIKQKPAFIKKQKVKLKNLWKMTKSAQVKDLCYKLLPDICSTGKSPITKAVPNRSKTDGKSNQNQNNKDTAVVGKKARVKAQSQEKETALMPSRNMKQPERKVTAGKATKGEPSDIQRDTVVAEIDDIDEESHKCVPDLLNDLHEVKDSAEKTTSEEPSEIQGDKAVAETDIDEESHKRVPDLPLDDLHEVKDSAKARVDSENEIAKTQVPTNSFISEVIHETGDEKVESESLSSEKVDASEDFNTSISNQCNNTDVHLYSCVASSSFISRLCEKLKMAGYDNIVKKSNEEKCGDNATGAKVVVLCCDRFDETCDKSLARQVLQFEKDGLPLIYLRSRPLTCNDTSQLSFTGTHTSIRFYSKPGEETVQATNWPKYKFCELLMQLNYHGVLRDDKLVTSEFRSLWEKRTDEKEKHLKKSFDDRSFLLPDIFVSYHWGKQRQVEPLYSHLMSEGLLCWMGAYQMDGSESLYNKIHQGLQSCRVVLACVTKKYEQCEICQCDIRTASKLGRVIVPVLIDDCQWPLGGEIGAILKESNPINLKSVYNVQRGFLPSGLKKLISRLKYYTLTNRDDHVLEIPSEIRCDTIDEEEGDDDIIDEFNEHLDISNRIESKVSKSSTLLEFNKHQGDKEMIARRHSNAIDVVRGSVTSEPLWSDDGYPLRVSRSKSCTLL